MGKEERYKDVGSNKNEKKENEKKKEEEGNAKFRVGTE